MTATATSEPTSVATLCPTEPELVWLSGVAESISRVADAMENVASLFGEAADDLSVIDTNA